MVTAIFSEKDTVLSPLSPTQSQRMQGSTMQNNALVIQTATHDMLVQNGNAAYKKLAELYSRLCASHNTLMQVPVVATLFYFHLNVTSLQGRI